MSSTRSWINSIFSAIEPTIFQNSVFGHLIYAKKKLYDMDKQMGNFVRGKLAVVMILWGFTTVAFSLSGLNYPLFWGFLTGLSTLVPYFGPIIVSIPIFLVAFLQFGTWWGFVKIGLIYVGFQTIEGNILTPFITGKTTHIHPTLIILSILICNYLWGFWGVVFSVPLTIFIKSVLTQVIATWEVEKNSLTSR
jgi:putative permease